MSDGSRNDVDVLIVGAGMGGLTTALALHQRGISCRIHESVRELRPLGVGINLATTAMSMLSSAAQQFVGDSVRGAIEDERAWASLSAMARSRSSMPYWVTS